MPATRKGKQLKKMERIGKQPSSKLTITPHYM
jgi:hypothetical protein